jgi:hypothetical protein
MMPNLQDSALVQKGFISGTGKADLVVHGSSLQQN